MRYLLLQLLAVMTSPMRGVFPRLVFAVRRRLVDAQCQTEQQQWDQRIGDVIACPDNALLQRVDGAGRVRDGFQMMHNGIEVVVDGYYGEGITRMLAANSGCHEPQEEIVFEKIIASLPRGAVIVEAGAYWAFYSMWFCKTVPEARAYLIEPSAENIKVGIRNFEHNHCKGHFVRGYVGAHPEQAPDGEKIISLDDFSATNGLEHIHIVHADVQSAESDMLDGADKLLRARSVDYWFISTHSMKLHQRCRNQLERHGYSILVSVDLPESYSTDGLLVASSPLVKSPEIIVPCKKIW